MAKLSLKLTTLLLLTLVLLLSSTISHSARPDSTFSQEHKIHVDGKEVDGEESPSCEGVGEEDCLMRRTLVAHLDYIYTQNHKP